MHGPCVDIWHVGGGLSHLKIRSTNKTKKYRKKRKKNEMKRDEEKSKGKKKGSFLAERRTERKRERRRRDVTPQTRGSVDYPSTRGILVNVGRPDIFHENRAKSPLYGELYPSTIPAYTCPK